MLPPISTLPQRSSSEQRPLAEWKDLGDRVGVPALPAERGWDTWENMRVLGKGLEEPVLREDGKS